MVPAPRIYNRLRTVPGEGASPAEIAAWGFSVVQIAPLADASGSRSLAPWTDLGLAVMTEVWPDHSWTLGSPLQRLEVAIRTQLERGVAGITCRHAHEIPAEAWSPLLQGLKIAFPAAWFCAEALGRPIGEVWTLQGAGFDFLFSSVGWWNGIDPWFLEQQALFPAVGRSIGFPILEPGMRAAERLERFQFVSLLSAGVLLDAGDEAGIAAEISALNRWKATQPRRRAESSVPAPGQPPSRVIIERMAPELDGGGFPVKRIVGDALQVTADIFRDGHDKVSAELRVQQFGESDWTVAPMLPVENDRWSGQAVLDRVGEARFVIAAWTDHFASWVDEVTKKRAASQPLRLELAEGRALVAAAVSRSSGAVRAALTAVAQRCDDPAESETRQLDLLLSRLVALWMAQAPDLADAALSPARAVSVERVAARFSAWYEMFPRSQGTVPGQSGTFADCVRRFPAIRDLGFDVVYFVPIHPIGEVNRKGRNNHPRAQPGEPGSPYAIGSPAGGHTAIEPSLGTLEDFRGLIAAAHAHGLEIALDFAVQCAPDHPWLKEHPQWFKRRSDGSIKHAENPPKKYEDIVNVDFDGPDWRGLWDALRDAVQFWIDEGVKIFRVDNPHTKPVAFWHWLIASLHERHPDVLFLAEAFTRPKMMRRLAKEGFSQSYTYFTWRTTKVELTDFLTELTRTESVEYFRPNFFPTTPDILPLHLQAGGRAGFRARLVLAATLSGSYGIYNGYELCEAGGLPGKEEYQDSEKYQFTVWDWDRPGNIKEDIRRLNRLRRSSPALQQFANLEFLSASHPAVLFYQKTLGRDRVVIAVSLDFHQPVQTEVVFPLAAWNLPPGGRFVTEELFSGYRQEWIGDRHVITLSPAAQPALVWKLL